MTIMGARDMAGLVTRALVPNTIDDRGCLEGNERRYVMPTKTFMTIKPLIAKKAIAVSKLD